MEQLAGQPRQRPLSVSEITTRNWDFAADVAGYKAVGVDAIGVWRSNWKPASPKRPIASSRSTSPIGGSRPAATTTAC